MLRSDSIGNNSNIWIGEIGEGDDGALVCVTDLIRCCRDDDTPSEVGALGDWFYPNGSAVPVHGSGYDFYRNRGTGIVRLYRRNNTISITGQFCCVVPDALDVMQRVCATISELEI